MADQQNNKKPLHVHIREIVWDHDLPGVMDIEHRNFEFPWKKDNFDECQWNDDYHGYVALVGNDIVGYMIYDKSDKTKINLCNIVVDEEHRHMGIATQMIEELVEQLSDKKKIITTNVRETNLPAQQFLRDCGFDGDSVVRNSYSETNEDAYVMRFKLLSVEQKIIRAIEKLESLTGVQWEIADRKGYRIHETHELQGRKEITTETNIALRTRGVIKNPKAAGEKLDELWHTVSHVIDENLPDQDSPLILPVSTISQLYMNRGKEGQLAGAFELSNNTKPESLAERERDRQNRGKQHDGGIGGRGGAA